MTTLWAPILAGGFPNPIGWAVDKVTGFVGDIATEGFEALIGGLAAWVTDAVVWVIGGVFNFFIDATDPNVQADWFVADDGPYGTMVAIGAVLLLGFLLAGITQGVLVGDVGGMLRRIALDLPVSVLGMVGLVTVTQALIRLTDELSTVVLGNFEDDIADFTAVVTSLSRLAGGAATALVVVLLGLVTVLAGLILVAELAVRAALIYFVVALAPLVLAARLWPSLEGVAKRLLQLLVALILSKLAMAVALAVAASAAVGTGSGGEVTALPPPEVFAEDPGGSVTQAVGVLLAAVAAFGVAAFSPLLVSRLLPLAEGAVVAQGIRGMPARGATQAASMAYYGQGLTGIRLQRLAQGGGGSGFGPSSDGPGPPGSSRPPRGRPPSTPPPGSGRGGGTGRDGGGAGTRPPRSAAGSAAGAGTASGAASAAATAGGPAGAVAAARTATSGACGTGAPGAVRATSGPAALTTTAAATAPSGTSVSAGADSPPPVAPGPPARGKSALGTRPIGPPPYSPSSSSAADHAGRDVPAPVQRPRPLTDRRLGGGRRGG